MFILIKTYELNVSPLFFTIILEILFKNSYKSAYRQFLLMFLLISCIIFYHLYHKVKGR
jgi:hypothetical protein